MRLHDKQSLTTRKLCRNRRQTLITTVEERNSDVPELMDIHGEEFEVDCSDSEDKEMEFADSFL